MDIGFDYIGAIHTPYTESAPYQPIGNASGEFYLEVRPDLAEGLLLLETFEYIYVLFHIDRLGSGASLTVSPPWADGQKVGVFASRSPSRPNPIGLSVVRIKRIEGNLVHVSGLDVFDGTPLLDIKPYIAVLDVKADANLGWVGEIDDQDHLALHIQGVPHGSHH